MTKTKATMAAIDTVVNQTTPSPSTKRPSGKFVTIGFFVLVAIAMVGWLWLLGWLVAKLFGL